MPDADTNPTAAQYFKRVNKQKRDHRDKTRDDIYNEVDRDLRKQYWWHGKKAPRVGIQLEGESYGTWEEVSPGRHRWRPTKAQ